MVDPFCYLFFVTCFFWSSFFFPLRPFVDHIAKQMFFFAFASVVRTSTPRKVAALTSCVVPTLRSQRLLSTCCHFPSRTSSLLYPSVSLRLPLFPHLTPLGPNPCLFSTAPVPVNTRDHSDELKSLIERVRSAEKQPRSQRRQFLEEIDLRAPALLALGTRS